MDRFISQFPAQVDGDLKLCLKDGVAYQADRSHIIQYDETYWNKCAGYEDSEIALKINRGRIGFVECFYRGDVLDIGIGCGEFIKKRPGTFGYDINPVAVKWLIEQGLFRDDFSSFTAFTMWDVLEHVENPEDYFINFRQGSFLFLSIPIFDDLTRVRESRHYRPGEHLYYFTLMGIKNWMNMHGFQIYGASDFETDAGRDSIHSLAFKKV